MKSYVEGKGGISATVIADSVSSVDGKRITTFELEYHRYIHSEFMTHRILSKNAMSSRAVPVRKMIEQVESRPATPIHWGANQSGMQADKENNEKVFSFSLDSNCIDDWDYLDKRVAWTMAAVNAAIEADYFREAGYHKQIVNRLIEPFQMMKTVVTATEYDNFFWLRMDKDAQPEIQELATCMYLAVQDSVPQELQPGEWHTPYVKTMRADNNPIAGWNGELLYLKTYMKQDDGTETFTCMTEEEALKVSASCCAQVSYRNLDNSFEKAMNVHERLVNGTKVHASPFEHQASPMQFNHCDDSPWRYVEGMEGVTHEDRSGYLWSGNFKGWIQHRQLLDNHVCWDFKELKDGVE